MARDNSSGMDWGKARTMKGREPSYHAPGTLSDRPGLHKNCAGCNHIIDKACRFVKFPKNRKWPCSFR